jgi:hypothetical protein
MVRSKAVPRASLKGRRSRIGHRPEQGQHVPRDGAIIFADLIGRLDVLYVHCSKCGRADAYRVQQSSRSSYRNHKSHPVCFHEPRVSQRVCKRVQFCKRADLAVLTRLSNQLLTLLPIKSVIGCTQKSGRLKFRRSSEAGDHGTEISAKCGFVLLLTLMCFAKFSSKTCFPPCPLYGPTCRGRSVVGHVHKRSNASDTIAL